MINDRTRSLLDQVDRLCGERRDVFTKAAQAREDATNLADLFEASRRRERPRRDDSLRKLILILLLSEVL